MDKMYTQAQFDSALLNLLVKMRNQGKEYVTVISKDLHDLVVNETSCNRMPMACNAMWKFHKIMGGAVISTTNKNKSSTIKIEYNLV